MNVCPHCGFAPTETIVRVGLVIVTCCNNACKPRPKATGETEMEARKRWQELTELLKKKA